MPAGRWPELIFRRLPALRVGGFYLNSNITENENQSYSSYLAGGRGAELLPAGYACSAPEQPHRGAAQGFL